jgi:RNA polymerase sigma factor (sigma-70 family)
VSSPEDTALATVVRAEAGLIVAALHRRWQDFDLAEEAVQEAVTTALHHWRQHGVPPNPGAWLTLTAQRKAIDLQRSRSRRGRLLADLDEAHLAAEPMGDDGRTGFADERLPMLFACCHPALPAEARLALTLRAVVGLTTAQIARAFLVPEPTLAQRLVRAKRKINAAGIPFTVPEGGALAPRLDDVLTVVYLAYNAGYLDPEAADLCGDAIWLAELVARTLPEQPEAWGLLALLTFLSARAAARFDEAGKLVVLREQDRSRWDAVAFARADGYLARAAALRCPGRYQLQAAIAAVHGSAERWEDTDWLQILTLYDLLLQYEDSPVVRLNAAIALGHHRGPAAALAAVEHLADRLADYHLFHATRAALLTELGELDDARLANERALALAATTAERELLRGRLGP